MAIADKYREVYRTMGGPPRLFGFGKNGARYAQMCDAINAMCEKMNNLCTPDQSGQRPEYTPGENEELKALQTRTVEACLEYIGGRKPEDILFRSEYVRYMSAKRIIELVDKERRKMEDIDFSIHPTLRDVIGELLKPGRDPRDELPAPVLRTDVLDMKDLKPGMELKGTVRNVIDFGAFVDIGVHQDGLVHISEIAERYIANPADALALHQHVMVKVTQVDHVRKRISLSIKQANN